MPVQWGGPATLDLTGYQRTIEKGEADGYPELDGTGKVPGGQLPAPGGASDSLMVDMAQAVAGGVFPMMVQGDLVAWGTLAADVVVTAGWFSLPPGFYIGALLAGQPTPAGPVWTASLQAAGAADVWFSPQELEVPATDGAMTAPQVMIRVETTATFRLLISNGVPDDDAYAQLTLIKAG